MPRVFAHAHLGGPRYVHRVLLDLGLAGGGRGDRGATARPRDGPGRAGLGAGAPDQDPCLVPAADRPGLGVDSLRSRDGPSRPVGVWLAVGLATFFAGWPWLWYDPVGRLRAYLGTGVERVSILVLYFGQVYAGSRRPLALPLVLLRGDGPGRPARARDLGAGPRLDATAKADPFPLLLAGSIALFLVVFSTRVPVYDGERLFLVAFPLLAILIGLGASRRSGIEPDARAVGPGSPCWSARLMAWSLIHPFGLSYYNALVGGLPGAERLGLELTYWGDAVNPVLLGRTGRPGQGRARPPRWRRRWPPIRGRSRPPADWRGSRSSSTTRTRRGGSTGWSSRGRSAYWTPAVKARVAVGRDRRDPVEAGRLALGLDPGAEGAEGSTSGPRRSRQSRPDRPFPPPSPPGRGPE